jgi:biopolymer transport protein ExbD
MAASNYLKRKHRRHKKQGNNASTFKDIELNIMPFIDVFSLLTTFLLMAAVFVAIGIIEVQIPFLSTTKPEVNPPRVLDLKVDMEKKKVLVITSYTKAPRNEVKKKFGVNAAGIEKMHVYLVSIKRKNPDVDKVSFFTEDDVLWKDMAAVLDAIKLRNENDPIFVPKEKQGDERAMAVAASFLFPKVVLSSVML